MAITEGYQGKPPELHPDFIFAHRVMRTVNSLYAPQFAKIDTPTLDKFRESAQLYEIEQQFRRMEKYDPEGAAELLKTLQSD